MFGGFHKCIKKLFLLNSELQTYNNKLDYEFFLKKKKKLLEDNSFKIIITMQTLFVFKIKLKILKH